jgi:heat shock protein HslJ
VTDAEGWVDRRRLSTVVEDAADALRSLDLLVASVDELRGDEGTEAIERLRAWAGPGPELVVTAGTAGAWVEQPGTPIRHVPAEVVAGRHTIGAGDAFAAVLVARRGAGAPLDESAADASRATARYLASRPQPENWGVAVHSTLSALDGTVWRAVRFGPRLETTPPPDADFSLEIQGDRLAGQSGCNRYMGSWSVEDGKLHIGPLASTMMFCDGLMEFERTFLDGLGAVTRAELRNDLLVVGGEDGADLIELATAEPAAS